MTEKEKDKLKAKFILICEIALLGAIGSLVLSLIPSLATPRNLTVLIGGGITTAIVQYHYSLKEIDKKYAESNKDQP